MVEFNITDTGITRSEGRYKEELSSANFTRNARQRYPESTGLLPPAVRWISASGMSVILERPPFTARVGYRAGRAGRVNEARAAEYYLPVPWQVYGITFNPGFRSIHTMCLYVRNAPLMTEQDSLHMFPYPNTFNDGRVCMGNDFDRAYIADPATCLSEALSRAVNSFWTADFNEDIDASWREDWRVPMDNLPARLRQNILDRVATGTEMLEHYANVRLEDFLAYRFPVGNTMAGGGDTLEHLIERLGRNAPASPMKDYASFKRFLMEMFQGIN